MTKLNTGLYIYIYIYICVCIYIYIYIYICTHTKDVILPQSPTAIIYNTIEMAQIDSAHEGSHGSYVQCIPAISQSGIEETRVARRYWCTDPAHGICMKWLVLIFLISPVVNRVLITLGHQWNGPVRSWEDDGILILYNGGGVAAFRW